MFIVGPSPYINGDGELVVVLFVQRNDSRVISGEELEEAVNSVREDLAREVGQLTTFMCKNECSYHQL